ncbi:MAG: PqqD family protein [Clostridia bacterium]|nr:PqqD family protein [Clostridia bacterium]
MKIKEGFALRKVADEFIVMPTGSNIARFDGAIALNEVSAFIFEKLLNPLSKEDLLAAVLDEYDVDRETAAKDIDSIIAKFDEMGILG